MSELTGSAEVRFFAVAKTGKVARGYAVRVIADGVELALFNLNGVFYATDESCSRANASLVEEFIPDGTVECPLHGACFFIETGEALSEPAAHPIKTYPVRVAGDDVLVGVSNDATNQPRRTEL